LAEFLHLVDNYIHGAVITIAIDKRIGTVFGKSKWEEEAQVRSQR
jgi:hypothetical protein